MWGHDKNRMALIKQNIFESDFEERGKILLD